MARGMDGRDGGTMSEVSSPLASSSFSNEEATRGMNAVARSVSPAAALQGLVIMVILQD